MADDGGVAARVAPVLERIAGALAIGPARDRLRGGLLDGAFRAADRWSSVTWRGGAPAASRPRLVTTGRTEGGVLVVRIPTFTRDAGEQVAVALAGESRVPAVILDLRGTTGGSMLGAAAVADLFLDRGVICEALDRDGRPVAGLRPRVEASAAGDVTTPLGVLVDARTGSSSELLAAALQRHGRAVISGERTFGKTVVGRVHALGPHVTLKITSALLHAAGSPLPSGGLTPTLASSSPEDLAARIVRA